MSSTLSTPRRISNSEVSTWLQCERKYYYAFDLNLTPRVGGQALTRGIIGHEVLATYYTVLMESGGNVVAAANAADEHLRKLLARSTESWEQELIMDCHRILGRYWEFAANDNWQILAVEKSYDIPMTDEFTFAMRLDILADIGGEITLVDHKFVYDFWQQQVMDMNPQMPKYIGTLRNNGLNVSRAMINQLRTRTKKGGMTDEEMFKRAYIKPTQPEIREHMREHILAARQVTAHRSQPVEARERSVLRTMNKMNCNNCHFADLCKAQLMGGDVTYMLQYDYKQNDTYGYNVAATEDK